MTEQKALPVRSVLVSWGVAVLMLAGLFSAWVWHNQERQNRDMCAMISVFLAGPEPLPGPTGDRSRVVRAGMRDYYERRDCADYQD